MNTETTRLLDQVQKDMKDIYLFIDPSKTYWFVKQMRTHFLDLRLALIRETEDKESKGHHQ